MASFQFEQTLGALKGKVVILTGGANGIGAAFVQFCVEQGAYVCSGDLDDAAGQAVVNKAIGQTARPEGKPAACFKKTNVAEYQSLVELFQFCLETYGRIDSAVSCAGIIEMGNWFDANLTLETVREIPTRKVVDVNLVGSLYFARIATVYLREGRKEGDDKSLILISSVAGFKESPGIFIYQATKHGVLGLMRSLRLYLPDATGIRVNAVCPWMVATGMVAGFESAWREAQLPVNEPIDVARIIAGISCTEGMNGKAIYVEGGRGWEIEDNIDRLEPQWLGEEQSRELARGQELLGAGNKWSKK